MRANDLAVAQISDELKGRDFSDFLENVPSISDVERWLDQLSISADAKSHLLSIARVTVKIGQTVVEVGRKIMKTIRELVVRFPNTTFGVVVGIALTLLVGTIPLIGALLGGILGPLFMAFGLVQGAFADMREREIEHRMHILALEYAVLRT